MIGDDIKDWLDGMGITQESYLSMKKALRLGDDCNCEACRKTLNELHEHWKKYGTLSMLLKARQIRRRNYHPIKVD